VRSLPIILALLVLGCDSHGITGDAGTDPTPDLPENHDRDGDTILDEHEDVTIPADMDGDTLPNSEDLDSDDDTIPDSTEAGDTDVNTPPVDSDDDGLPDFVDLDSDDNGMLDADEGGSDVDGDTVPDHADPDNDGDMIDDEVEFQGHPEDPPDTDGDTIPDHNDIDSDDDTISDRHEQAIDTDEDLVPDYLDLDTDNDSIPDSEEAGDDDLETPPVDTDRDFIPDYRDYDSDNDGLSDAWERENGLDPYNEDSDADGFPDLIEVGAGTDPLDATDNPRTRPNYLFVMHYNDEWTPEDEALDPDPTMDHVVLQTGTSEPMDVTAVLRDDPTDSVDTVADFILHIEPSVVGGFADPRDPTRICVGGLEVADLHEPLDGTPDSFTAVPADTPVCFDLHVKQNWSVPATHDPQTFSCDINLMGEGTILLDTETVFFLVPPEWGPPFP
jgi:hypothetical protein